MLDKDRCIGCWEFPTYHRQKATNFKQILKSIKTYGVRLWGCAKETSLKVAFQKKIAKKRSRRTLVYSK